MIATRWLVVATLLALLTAAGNLYAVWRNAALLDALRPSAGALRR